jgi:hypothetical protein
LDFFLADFFWDSSFHIPLSEVPYFFPSHIEICKLTNKQNFRFHILDLRTLLKSFLLSDELLLKCEKGALQESQKISFWKDENKRKTKNENENFFHQIFSFALL